MAKVYARFYRNGKGKGVRQRHLGHFILLPSLVISYSSWQSLSGPLGLREHGRTRTWSRACLSRKHLQFYQCTSTSRLAHGDSRWAIQSRRKGHGMQASRQRGLQTEVHKYLLPLKWLQGADVVSESQLVLFVDSAWKASRRERTSDTKEARNASVSVGRI